ncbi:MAG TPA: hypothetical protein ENJ29_14810 [Bacteroidetes bacterium]|nr:hypothetical protein [Bacteroidota bacterium]
MAEKRGQGEIFQFAISTSHLTIKMVVMKNFAGQHPSGSVRTGTRPEHPVFKRGFLNLGHRGVPNLAPENTLAGFRLAHQQHATGIELDVRVCKSGELVVIHDARVNRTTTGRGFVRARTLQQLRLLDAGIRFGEKFRGQRIPTLEQVFTELPADFVLNIEIKGHPRVLTGVDEQLLHIIHKHDAMGRVIISSFNPIILRRLRRRDTRIATGFLVDRTFFIKRSEKAILKWTGFNAIHLDAALATPRFISRLREMGLHCIVWGDLSLNKIQTLLSLDIDGLITDFPDVIHFFLNRERL